MDFLKGIVIFLFVINIQFILSNGKTHRCFSCRSRGELGDCKDPFRYNETSFGENTGISVISCRSGWCAKFSEGIRGPRDEYGSATERNCLLQAPSDNEERCTESMHNNKPTYFCYCRGDLCNSASSLHHVTLAALSTIATLGLWILS